MKEIIFLNQEKIVNDLMKGGPGSGGSRPGAGRPPGAKNNLKEEKELTTSRLLEQIKHQKQLGSGINGSYILKLKNGEKAIFKPADEEDEDILKQMGEKSGGLMTREVCAYQISKIVDNDMIPETIERNINGLGKGSVQKWMPGKVGGNLNKISKEDIEKAALFDEIMGNPDRHDGNYLVNGNKLQLIDNGIMLTKNKEDVGEGEILDRYAIISKQNYENTARTGAFVYHKSSVKKYNENWNKIEKIMRTHKISESAIRNAHTRLKHINKNAK